MREIFRYALRSSFFGLQANTKLFSTANCLLCNIAVTTATVVLLLHLEPCVYTLPVNSDASSKDVEYIFVASRVKWECSSSSVAAQCAKHGTDTREQQYTR